MRSINRSATDVLLEDKKSSLSRSDEKRFARNILEVMGALSCLLAGKIYQSFFPQQDVVLDVIYFVGVMIIGIPIAITAIRGFLKEQFSSAMEILVVIAMLISVLTNEYVLAIMIPLLLSIVHFFEEKSIIGGRDAIEGLKKMQSTSALRIDADGEKMVDARELKPGDEILVKPGMSLPVDGVILKGCSNMDQQSLTGESLPKYVQPGDKVYAGTMNLEGTLTVRVEKGFEDTSFQKIVRLLEESEHSSVPAARITDKFLQYYIPIAIIAATLTWLLTREINRAVAILVVSCPCGHMLVSSAPMIAALSVATKRGVLIKSTGFIETLAGVDKVYFDKTGTLTNGSLSVKSCIPVEGISEEEVYAAGLSVAIHSAHPLSRALAEKKEEYAHSGDYEIKEQGGLGVCGQCGESTILLGNEAFLRNYGISLAGLPEIGETSTYVAKDGQLLGVILYQDTMREGTREVITELKQTGVVETGLLTGDKEQIALQLKERSGLDVIQAQLLPEQKQQWIIKAKEGHSVAFVGDGINDSLALSAADVGIAMGAMGVDTAIQSADIALMNSDLWNIPFLFDLAKVSRRIIGQNLIIAFSSSFIMAILAGTGIISALPGALLHNIGAFFVLLNSSRILRRFRTRVGGHH